MKNFLLLLVATVMILCTSCSDYGTKVNINDKSEVYYKGEGVTEADAKKLGNFLLQENFFNTTQEKSVQLKKDSGIYLVRFVLDKETYEKEKEALNKSFRYYQTLISENVFANAKTKVILTDVAFNDIGQAGEPTADEKALFSILYKAAKSEAADSTSASDVSTPQ